jgi:hypothetical protein
MQKLHFISKTNFLLFFFHIVKDYVKIMSCDIMNKISHGFISNVILVSTWNMIFSKPCVWHAAHDTLSRFLTIKYLWRKTFFLCISRDWFGYEFWYATLIFTLALLSSFWGLEMFECRFIHCHVKSTRSCVSHVTKKTL